MIGSDDIKRVDKSRYQEGLVQEIGTLDPRLKFEGVLRPTVDIRRFLVPGRIVSGLFAVGSSTGAAQTLFTATVPQGKCWIVRGGTTFFSGSAAGIAQTLIEFGSPSGTTLVVYLALRNDNAAVVSSQAVASAAEFSLPEGFIILATALGPAAGLYNLGAGLLVEEYQTGVDPR